MLRLPVLQLPLSVLKAAVNNPMVRSAAASFDDACTERARLPPHHGHACLPLNICSLLS
jgi:hypothetical protein